MSYYDVDAILTDGEKIPCQFELDIPHLGHLDNSPAIKPGTRLPLPLWLAEMLALASSSTSHPPLTLNMPVCLSDTVMAALKADPRAVPLRDQSAHFFAVGARMLDLFDERDVGLVIRRALVVRATDVALHARKAEEAGVSRGDEFLRGLDEWERRLFRGAHVGVRAMKEWADNVKRA